MKILTKRKYITWPSYDLVYEWENDISRFNKFTLFNSILLDIKFTNKVPFLTNWILGNDPSFYFQISASYSQPNMNSSKITPCVIDFYLKKSQLKDFEKSHYKNPIVYISSKEIFDFLEENHCNLNIKHLPLSISDKYKITPTTKYNKIYDLVIMGRVNPKLFSFLETYVKRHPTFKYVYRELKNKVFNYYCSDGTFIGNINTRDQYIELMQKAKCGFYATPGMDDSESRTNGFNQVTPRFLELIACGCHILARYPENPDTKYFELHNITPSIESYEQFEHLLNKALNEEVDMQIYADYLKNHYTSKIAKQIMTDL